MKTAPITPAQIDFGDPRAPRAPGFDDIYHPPGQALAQAEHVFLAGNRLPGRWAGRDRFTILETGFGLGNNFLATWNAWRDDPKRCARLQFVSIELHPPTRADLGRAHRDSALPLLASELIAAWPPLTPDWHVIDFEHGRVRLLLGLGDANELLPALVAQADAIYLDGFAPAKNPRLWNAQLLRILSRVAAPGATAATWSVAHAVRNGLQCAGFATLVAPGFGAKREMTCATYAPRHPLQRPPGRRSRSSASALVIGAGLAGASVARALALQGIGCQVVERHAGPAAEASGMPAGIFHSVVHADDGRHARWFRAAALLTERLLRPLVADHRVDAAISGVLRLEQRLPLAQMQSILQCQRLPPELVQAVDARRAGELSGLRCEHNAWWFPGGGWAAPASLVGAWLSAPSIATLFSTAVDRIVHLDGGWQALDSQGREIARADVIVLANAADAMRLASAAALPLHRVRGQISRVSASTPGLILPRMPVAGAGYAIPLAGGDSATARGELICGATSAVDDEHAHLRALDHRHNLDQLCRLTGSELSIDPGGLDGRVGWRLASPDRLPVLGPMPVADLAADTRVDQPRLVPRQPDLYVATGFGSRGITQAALAGEVVAAWISGAPMPVAADLIDAVDVARFTARTARRQPRA